MMQANRAKNPAGRRGDSRQPPSGADTCSANSTNGRLQAPFALLATIPRRRSAGRNAVGVHTTQIANSRSDIVLFRAGTADLRREEIWIGPRCARGVTPLCGAIRGVCGQDRQAVRSRHSPAAGAWLPHARALLSLAR